MKTKFPLWMFRLGMAFSLLNFNTTAIGAALIAPKQQATTISCITKSPVLPVRIIQFVANRLGKYVFIQWETAHEVMGDVYTVERSTDGVHFTRCAFLFSNPANENKYRYQDTFVAPIVFYRISISGKPDEIFKSNTIVVVQNDRDAERICLKQNPVEQSLQVETVFYQAHQVQLILRDNMGRVVWSLSRQVPMGIQLLQIPVPANLANGWYWLQMGHNQLQLQKPILLAR
jgi:nitrous oxidase accessory protein NosD